MQKPADVPLALETSPLLEKLTLAYAKARAMRFSPHNLNILDALKSQYVEISTAAGIQLHKLEDGLQDLIVQDEQFFGTNTMMIKTNNGSFGFYPSFVSGPLIRRALLTDSPEEAINWLQKVLRTTSAVGTTTNALWGAPVEQEVILFEGVKIIPIEELPDSPNKQWITKHSLIDTQLPVMSMLSFTPPQSALVVSRKVEPFIVDPEREPRSPHNDYLQIHELMQNITLVLTVVGPRTVMSSARWFTFDDPDLEHACMFSGRSTQMLEILPNQPSNEPTLNGAEAQEIVLAYLALQSATQAKVRVALQRLSQSLRRHNVGDRAVELATALETLLGDDATTEMTHKIKVRSVRLIGGTNDTRIRNAAIINKTYNIRSKLVHTGRVDAAGSDTICGERVPISYIVEQATRICADVIKIIIRRGLVPDWSIFDITENT
jgi:hypothetical protein